MTMTRRAVLKAAVATAAAPALAHLSALDAFAATALPLGPRVESQGWWRKAGILVPSAVGEHIHLEVEHPDPKVIYDGLVTFTVRVQTHGLTGQGVRYIRLQQADGTGQAERVHLDIPGGLVGDTDTTYTIPVDFSKWRTGRSEMRWTANCPANGEGNRFYQSTGYQVTVRSASPSYRTDPYIEARGWYAEHNYANDRWLTPLASIRRGSTAKIKIGPGSGGKATKLAIVAANPHYHMGDPGLELLRTTTAGTFSILVPGNLPDGSKLVAISSDGQLAGVSSIPVAA